MLLEAAGPLDDRTVLDVGCGTGRLLPQLRHPSTLVIGLDREPSALAMAAGRHPHRVLLADAEALPLAEAAADVAIASTVCEFAGDPEGLVRELVRITRTGGRVVIGLLNRGSPWGWWNRHHFDEAPWDRARFVPAQEMLTIGRAFGECELRSGLFAPRHLPFIRRWSSLLEGIGRRVAPGRGAFQVLTIRPRTDRRTTEPGT